MDKRNNYMKHLQQRFLKAGLKGFLDIEILELLLMYSIPKRNVSSLAKKLLDIYGSLEAVIDAEVKELIAVPGMDVNSAVLLRMAKDYPDIYLRKRVLNKYLINCWLELLKYCQMTMSKLKVEQFKVVFLNLRNEIIEIETLHEGTLDETVIYPRKIMERALYHNAAGLIFFHNHPNGSIQPSFSDKCITRTLVIAAASMDIEVYDHIIIGNGDHFSFMDSGLLLEEPKPFASSLNLQRKGFPRMVK